MRGGLCVRYTMSLGLGCRDREGINPRDVSQIFLVAGTDVIFGSASEYTQQYMVAYSQVPTAEIAENAEFSFHCTVNHAVLGVYKFPIISSRRSSPRPRPQVPAPSASSAAHRPHVRTLPRYRCESGTQARARCCPFASGTHPGGRFLSCL